MSPDLVMAHAMAAWGDVARRIAHEDLKNPPDRPIQLSGRNGSSAKFPLAEVKESEKLEQTDRCDRAPDQMICAHRR